MDVGGGREADLRLSVKNSKQHRRLVGHNSGAYDSQGAHVVLL